MDMFSKEKWAKLERSFLFSKETYFSFDKYLGFFFLFVHMSSPLVPSSSSQRGTRFSFCGDRSGRGEEDGNRDYGSIASASNFRKPPPIRRKKHFVITGFPKKNPAFFLSKKVVSRMLHPVLSSQHRGNIKKPSPSSSPFPPIHNE